MKSFLCSAVLLITSLPALGQQPMQLFDSSKSGIDQRPGPSTHWCATPHYMTSEAGRAAVDRYSEARASGTLPVARKYQESYQVGQSAMFNIQSDSAWTSAEFELRKTGNGWRLWIRSDEPDQDIITDQRLDLMAVALDEETPEGSIDPTRGIFENSFATFGDAPIYPEGSDGIIDLLAYELDPGVAGFFHPSDYDPNASDTVGNQSEVLYLDIDNFRVEGNGSMESVTAHELQHLIHFNYDNREAQFVNEGQSEYAQQMNGYGVIPPFYLFGPFPAHNVGFFDWAGLNSGDYQRASLWTGYVAERLGSEIVGMITRSDKVGLRGYEDAFSKGGSSMSFGELLADFHTANLINNRGFDPRFGYAHEQRSGELGKLQVVRFNGYDGPGLTTDSMIVSAGGAQYLTIENVKDVNMTVDVVAPPDQLENRRSQMLVRVIATDLDGNMSMTEFNPSDQIHEIPGSFDKVRLVFIQTRPESVQLRANFDITWSTDPDREVESVLYAAPNGLIRNGLGPIALDPEGRDAQATRFTPPPGSVLDRVTLATYYFSQFSNGGFPANAPRDLRLVVWASNGLGFPGEVIYSKEVVDPLPWTPAFQTYSWFDVEIDPPLDKDAVALPDTIFVGIENAGTDGNFLVTWPAASNRSPAPETGFLRLPIEGELTWTPLWDLVLSSAPDQRVFNLAALPVEARFVIDNRPVAVEQSTEIPESVALEQNYPNPFNPSTRIRFALPETGDVSLEVFDVTGRQVAKLLQGRHAAGSYTVTVNASTWTSGMYFYRLTAGEEQMIKRMVVLK